MSDVIRHLRKAALLQEACGLTDGQLLECFLARQDEAAFAVLVRRHGPMVLGVCRRVLGHAHDAEDAFQATFLVLARKAASVRSREVVGHWLYGVAYRTALKARATSARRRAKEQQVKDMPEPETPGDDGRRHLLPLLDQELARLPERYRVAVVLCDLEGVTRREAARRLNLPEGTLSGRLTTARRLLAKRLSQYGLAVSGGALAAALSGKTASAAVRQALAASTARAAVLLVVEQGVGAGAVPARVLALTEGVIKTMFLLKLRAFVAVAVVAFVGAGVVGLAYQTGAAEPGKAAGGPAAAGQAVAEDLEALRLEVEALRKSLQATRERVKTLEGEVQGLKEKAKTLARPEGETTSLGIEVGRVPLHLKTTTIAVPAKEVDVFAVTTVADPLSEAEAALKKLKERPDDKQAADALEKALQRLKEQPKVEHRLWQLQQLKEQPKPAGQPESPQKK
jgi:RNA polymerase sigma factor (sigma-70 family)